MKTLLISIGLLVSTIMWGQNCDCEKDTMLKKCISCKPIKFDNGSKLFWSFNCDSSWLTFENIRGEHKIIFSLEKDFLDLTTRLGYAEFQEFKTTFLVTNNVISGCCQPQDYYLHDKTSGNLIKYLGRTIYTSEDKNIPIVVSITNSKYDTITKPDYNSLTIYNLDNNKESQLALPKGDIKKGLKNNHFMFPEDLFETPEIKEDKLYIKYSTQRIDKNKPLKYKTIIIDLKKYSS